MEQTIIVSGIEQEGIRLDVFLVDALDDWTRSQIKIQIDNKNALVNGKPAKAGTIVKNGHSVSINFNKQVGLDDVKPEAITLDIVYEDADIIVVNKKQGMVVHPAPGNYEHTLVNALLYHFGELSNTNSIRPGIVHRIDKDTSGLLVVAKNDVAHAHLAAQIAEHSCKRTYIALLEGKLKTDSGTISTYLERDKKDRKKYAVSTQGKFAITHYEVIERYIEHTLARFQLETGRTHQIRVHAKHLGNPIVGDLTYGYSKQKFKLNGQLLHATKLELVHPITKKQMSFEAPLPDYFENVLLKLKKS